MDFRNQKDLPLGLRNNNPGNIRPGDKWEGIAGENKGFIVFFDITYGIRAMLINAANSIHKGRNTIDKFISHYAPSNENDTNGYIALVSNYIGKDKDDTLGKSDLEDLIKAQISVEIGKKALNKISDEDFAQAYFMAKEKIDKALP